MSTAEYLQQKILDYRKKLKDESDRLKSQRAAFEISAPLLFNHITTLLQQVDGVDVDRMPAHEAHPASKVGWLDIRVFDQKVSFVSADKNGQLCLDVTGLLDRNVSFWRQDGGKWSAEDERSSSPIIFSDELLFNRLSALVPG